MDGSGDGGNRTRVRKIQPLNVYKLSQPFIFIAGRPGQQGQPTPSRLPPKGLLIAAIDVAAKHVGKVSSVPIRTTSE